MATVGVNGNELGKPEYTNPRRNLAVKEHLLVNDPRYADVVDYLDPNLKNGE